MKTIKINPIGNANIRVNGRRLNGENDPVELKHNDRILFGIQHLFLFQMPGGPKPEKPINWATAHKEIAKAEGYGAEESPESRGCFHCFHLLCQSNFIF